MSAADEAWKVFICAQQALDAKSCANRLCYLAKTRAPGNISFDEQLRVIEQLSGAEIASLLRDYHDEGLKAIEAAILKADKTSS